MEKNDDDQQALHLPLAIPRHRFLLFEYQRSIVYEAEVNRRAVIQL